MVHINANKLVVIQKPAMIAQRAELRRQPAAMIGGLN
jgi:hypothetical protein